MQITKKKMRTFTTICGLLLSVAASNAGTSHHFQSTREYTISQTNDHFKPVVTVFVKPNIYSDTQGNLHNSQPAVYPVRAHPTILSPLPSLSSQHRIIPQNVYSVKAERPEEHLPPGYTSLPAKIDVPPGYQLFPKRHAYYHQV
ncbi:hypothetical protein QAD02_018925 [Eretmocerus hayati]|uniref:Uncharacterized protein n=1 Tax=Eretmocerus hayati TaxID=131215 RepID=A0ACC2PJ81_9HYME|nr:hypothetical protein QAD02_018925 [Eretmocerus hayati]